MALINILKTLKLISGVLTPKEKVRIYILFILSFISSLLDTIGIASIIPLINMLTDAEYLLSFPIVSQVFQSTGLDLIRFNLAVIIFTGLYFILSTLFRVFVTYSTRKFLIKREVSISTRLVDVYLSKEYLWIIKSTPSVLVKRILSEVNHIIASGLVPLGGIINSALIIISIFIFLFLVDPAASIIIFSSLSGLYLLIFFTMRFQLEEAGKKRSRSLENKFRLINEIFSGFKNIKIGQLEKTYSNLNKEYTSDFTDAQVKAFAISTLPRFILELLIFFAFLACIFYLLYSGEDSASLAPKFAAFVVSTVKLLPAVQQLYGSISGLSFASKSINEIVKDLDDEDTINLKEDKFDGFNDINIENLSFSYDSKNDLIKNFNLKIKSGDKIAITGPSGSGKSTLIELFSGLIKADSGSFSINGITNNIALYRKISIAYVPQNIFLYDASIKDNIIFSNTFNLDLLEKVIKVTAIDKAFNSNSFSSGLDTHIGEGGLRLSGGQKQRIGIARALYQNADILILDESISAIDEKSQAFIVKNILSSFVHKTVFLVTHNNNLTSHFDKIVKL